MSASNARDAAEEWVVSSGLPEDLKGRVVQLVTFTSEEDCRFFYPRRALAWQQQVNTYISRMVRGRKAKVVRIAPTPADFRTWLTETGRTDDVTSRRVFADGLQKLLEEDYPPLGTAS